MTVFLGLVLALLPTYLLRFNIFGIPATILEILIVVFLLAAIARLKISDLGKIKK